MDIIVVLVARLITGARTETIGLPQPTTSPTLATSTSALPISTRRMVAIRVMVSQFAVLQHLAKLKTNPFSSTSPSVIVENAPLNFVRGGVYVYSDGQLYDRGTHGYYWSTTGSGSTNSRGLNFYPSNFIPQNYNLKGYGLSVRCANKCIN